jgi:hypothetical protein
MNWTKDDVITTDKYLAAFPNDYYKTDIFFVPPVMWRGRFRPRPPFTAKLIVCGHSDFPMIEPIARHYPLAKWFCVNKQTSRVNGLPLGITNDTDESGLHRIYGNVDVMVDAASQPRDIKNLVYMNFSVSTYPAERQQVWDMFKDKPWVTVGEPVNTLDGRRNFLSEIRNHRFVLCPRGNGVDTHRLWETLYMGGIPIVLRNIAHSDWADLPILFVDSWEEVTEEFLNSQIERFETTQWNMNKLHVGYWIRQIQG